MTHKANVHILEYPLSPLHFISYASIDNALHSGENPLLPKHSAGYPRCLAILALLLLGAHWCPLGLATGPSRNIRCCKWGFPGCLVLTVVSVMNMTKQNKRFACGNSIPTGSATPKFPSKAADDAGGLQIIRLSPCVRHLSPQQYYAHLLGFRIHLVRWFSFLY